MGNPKPKSHLIWRHQLPHQRKNDESLDHNWFSIGELFCWWCEINPMKLKLNKIKSMIRLCNRVVVTMAMVFVDFEFYMISFYLWPNTRWKLPSASKQRRRLQVDHDYAVWCLSESCVSKKTDLHSSLLKSKHDERFIFLVFGSDWRWKNWWNEFCIIGMFFLWSNATYPSHCV